LPEKQNEMRVMLMQIDSVTATMAKEEIKMRQRRDAK
jgi:hypothetical protein